MPGSCRSWLLVLLVGLSAPARAASPALLPAPVEPEPNAIWIDLGGQIGIRSYHDFLKLGVGYERWLGSRLWLDLGLTALVQRNTDLGFLAGVRWIFGAPIGARPFIRLHLEGAILVEEGAVAFALTPRAGGGIAYFTSPGFGLLIEANAGLGAAFNGGVHLAAAIDILVGTELRF